jgi:hypothetical protein
MAKKKPKLKRAPGGGRKPSADKPLKQIVVRLTQEEYEIVLLNGSTVTEGVRWLIRNSVPWRLRYGGEPACLE